MFVYCIFVNLLEQSVILTQRKNYKIHETFHKQFKPKTLYFIEMFCMAGVPGAGALTGPCIRGWKGKFHVSILSPTCDFSRHACTYCGGDIEDKFSLSGILAACFLFPFGVLLCCYFKERRCVSCTRELV